VPSLAVANSQQAVNQTEKRRPRPVEDRPGRDRGAVTADGAHEPTVAKPPAIALPAVRAHEAFRPAKPLEVVEAGGISREPGLELATDLG